MQLQQTEDVGSGGLRDFFFNFSALSYCFVFFFFFFTLSSTAFK